jgi:TPR repeat protein
MQLSRAGLKFSLPSPRVFLLNAAVTVAGSGNRVIHSGGVTMHRLLALLVLGVASVAGASPGTFNDLLARAEQQDSGAMVATGRAYLMGDGVERDCYEARRWLKSAAEAGATDALFLLGTMDDEGSCGIAQAESAAAFYLKAAEKGHAGARYRLGELYRTGRGVDPDAAIAFRWLETAAGQGEPRAYCSLARLYARGSGVTASRQKAQRWLNKGLESRNAEAVELCREVRQEPGI